MMQKPQRQSSPNRAFRSSSSLLLTFLLLATAAHSAEPSIQKELPGRWGVVGEPEACGVRAQTYRLEGHTRLRVSSATALPLEQSLDRQQPLEMVFNILPIFLDHPHILRMEREGETRISAAGRPLIWDIYLKDSTTLCWHRYDTRGSMCSVVLKKC